MAAMSDAHRRRVLLRLLESNPTIVETIVPASDTVDRRMAVLQLRNVHLPKLEEDGFVTWDRETDELTRGPNFAELRPVLEALESHRSALPADYRPE